jgi:hypothetical protein
MIFSIQAGEDDCVTGGLMSTSAVCLRTPPDLCQQHGMLLQRQQLFYQHRLHFWRLVGSCILQPES